MTYREAVGTLRSAGIEEAGYEAGILFSELAGIDRAELLINPDISSDSPALSEAVRRRASREPLQYILGYWYFRGMRFKLDRSTLCPRPDTETLVDAAVNTVPRGTVFCDIGAGSGCVAVSVLSERPDLRCVAVDISEDALRIARENASDAGVADRCEFTVCDALDAGALTSLGVFGAVLSNPPYIPSGEIASLEPELSFEPRAALDGGEDGYDFYRTIIPGARLAPGGVMIFETGAGMAPGLCEIGRLYGLTSETRRDLSGIKRVVIMRKTETNRA